MCVASLKSMTTAIKAQKTLEGLNINCEIIKLDPDMTKKGCAYGVKFNCMDSIFVENALKQKRIRYTEIFRLQ